MSAALSQSLWECECQFKTARRKVRANGVATVFVQCNNCGRGAETKRANYDIDTLPAYDETIYKRWADHNVGLARRARDEENRLWWKKYNAYMATDVWRKRSLAVLERDRHECRARLSDCSGRAIQAHHLTYSHVFNEPLFDLIAVCSACHDEITRMDRERRSA